MHVLDAARRQLDDLHRIGAREHQLTDIDRNAGLGAHEQALDLGRPFDHAASPWLDRKPHPVHRAYVLHRTDRAQQVRPAAARQLGARCLIGA